jgi:hypothetical protein
MWNRSLLSANETAADELRLEEIRRIFLVFYFSRAGIDPKLRVPVESDRESVRAYATPGNKAL